MGSSKRTTAAPSFLRTTAIPLFLMLTSPAFILLLWVLAVPFNGDLTKAFSDPIQLLHAFPFPTVRGILIPFFFLLFQAILLVLLPSKRFLAVVTPMGNRPSYRLNGVPAFLITQGIVLGCWAFDGGKYVTKAYDWYGEILSGLTFTAPIVTGLLYIKGLKYPTSSDHGKSGNGIIWDLWQGTELHPEIYGISLKQLVNCRFSMMGWSVIIIIFGMKQIELYGILSNNMLISMALQWIYCLKFFVWEDGYFNSIDIIHDRFGFYICWGCIAFLPSVYCLTLLFLVKHPINLSISFSMLLFILGVFSIYANYDTDYQKQSIRDSNGQMLIWNRKPKLIHVSYTTGDGKKRSSFLLASGWWGFARHINYGWELLLAFCWCVPALNSGLLPYTYFIFLSILLVDRTYRDEMRCLQKYGEGYKQYCRQVPYKILPGIY